MDTVAVDASTITPIARGTDAAGVATAAYEQLATFVEQLPESDWEKQTECPGWTVADMVGHVIGAMKANAKVREMLRQQAYGARHAADHHGNSLDALNALQVADHRSLTPAERVHALRALTPGCVAGRMRLPSPIRRMSVPIAQTGSTQGMPSRLNLGMAMDVVYTRDAWLHTVDIARATGHPFPVGAPLNSRIVADVVREWAATHAQPFDLTLTGPAGGRFISGVGGAVITMDAVEFCRTLSGRAQGEGLLATHVIF